ncbi:MAG: aldehyde dehydrogenase family protein [Bacteroidota bacterium]
MDADLASIQNVRTLVETAKHAQKVYKAFSQAQVDHVVAAMVTAGADAAEHLAVLAHEETGFGRVESKTEKNRFATTTLHQRMQGMKTVGVIGKTAGDTIWEIATPMGVVGALIPSTNPTSTAMYKAIIAAKARCGIVMSPHPRGKACTLEALRVVAQAAYKAGAPEGLFGCMSEVTLEGTNALLEHPKIDLILATGGSAMVKAAYSKGKPAYGVGSGNVPVYVDRSANLQKAAADILYGTSFDWGTLCSTERSIIADQPIKAKLVAALTAEGGYMMCDSEKDQLRRMLLVNGRLNTKQVGQSPERIAQLAGFRVPAGTKALIGEVSEVGKAEPLSMETLSPILALYTEDGWQAGCERCIQVLHFGGIGHTLALHASNQRVIEAFALEKPSMRIVVNTVAALGSVGYTTNLFPAMTLGPGTLGGSITSDNISPMHLLNVKRLAFEASPVTMSSSARPAPMPRGGVRSSTPSTGWMAAVEANLLARAGNPAVRPPKAAPEATPRSTAEAVAGELGEEQIQALIRRFRKS